jgi:hypothetical protein
MNRSTYMQEAVMASNGMVLNVGCHVDGSSLKNIDPGRVINCDYEVQPGYQYEVDLFFDARKEWPVSTGSIELVVLGDIMEHFYPDEWLEVLAEARRVASKVCITVPRDEILGDPIDPDAVVKAHVTTVDEEFIKVHLEETGWTVTDLQTVTDQPEWSPIGYLVSAV